MAKEKKHVSNPIKSKIVRGALTVMGHLPSSFSHALAQIIGRILWRMDTKTKRTILINIDICFEHYSPQEKQALAKATLINGLISVFEMAHAWTAPLKNIEKIRIDVEGEALVKAAIKNDQGVILACPHLGNWELLNYYLANHFDLLALYRPPRMLEMDSFMQEVRQRFGGMLIPATPQGIKTLYRSLNHEKLLAILPDQEPGKSGGIFSPFFGKSALTMTLVSRLLKKNQSKLLFSFAERINHHHYKIHFMEPEAGIYSSDLQESVDALNRGVEKVVLMSPQQYQWTYKRFKSRPEGENRIYP